MNRPSRRELFSGPGNFFALGFGAGLAPLAPGTCGTLAAIPLYLLLVRLDPLLYAGVVAATFFIGVPLCARAAAALGVHDHPAIVWDEMVGLWVTLCFIPFSWGAVLFGFALFRLFDIVKPWPIRAIDRQLHGGIGIMLDDLIAGVFANIVLRLVLVWLPV